MKMKEIKIGDIRFPVFKVNNEDYIKDWWIMYRAVERGSEEYYDMYNNWLLEEWYTLDTDATNLFEIQMSSESILAIIEYLATLNPSFKAFAKPLFLGNDTILKIFG